MKKSERLIDSIGKVNDKFIEEYANSIYINKTKKASFSWRKFVASAACFVIAIVLMLQYPLGLYKMQTFATADEIRSELEKFNIGYSNLASVTVEFFLIAHNITDKTNTIKEFLPNDYIVKVSDNKYRQSYKKQIRPVLAAMMNINKRYSEYKYPVFFSYSDAWASLSVETARKFNVDTSKEQFAINSNVAFVASNKDWNKWKTEKANAFSNSFKEIYDNFNGEKWQELERVGLWCCDDDYQGETLDCTGVESLFTVYYSVMTAKEIERLEKKGFVIGYAGSTVWRYSDYRFNVEDNPINLDDPKFNAFHKLRDDFDLDYELLFLIEADSADEQVEIGRLKERLENKGVQIRDEMVKKVESGYPARVCFSYGITVGYENVLLVTLKLDEKSLQQVIENTPIIAASISVCNLSEPINTEQMRAYAECYSDYHYYYRNIGEKSSRSWIDIDKEKLLIKGSLLEVSIKLMENRAKASYLSYESLPLM